MRMVSIYKQIRNYKNAEIRKKSIDTVEKLLNDARIMLQRSLFSRCFEDKRRI
jgi:hypothetical protein